MRTIHDLPKDTRRALVRVDFNVGIENGRVTDDHRIRAALPTIRSLLDRDVSLVLMSHLGRPGGKPDPELSLRPVVERLREELDDATVSSCSEVVGDEAREAAAALGERAVLVLENLRFDPREKQGDDEFAKQLAGLGDAYVNDAFAASHRAHASMVAVARRFAPERRVAGLLVQREVETIDRILADAHKPFVVLMGGAKVADKIDVVRSLLDRADKVLLGGALAYTFLKAADVGVGASKVEEDKLDLANELLEKARDRILLPVDHHVARPDDPDRDQQVVEGSIPAGFAGFDIGPDTMERFRGALADARTLVWNGPMGLFEHQQFGAGTRAMVDAAARDGLTSLVGGGETADAVARAGKSDAITHLSTGGGAFLEYLARRTLPALEVLEED